MDTNTALQVFSYSLSLPQALSPSTSPMEHLDPLSSSLLAASQLQSSFASPSASYSSSSSPSSSSSSPHHDHQEQQQQPSVSDNINVSVNNLTASYQTIDDLFSCLVSLLTFWFFATMALILGFYGSFDLALGPHCSRLLQANSLFVQDIKVKTVGDSEQGVMLYGFHKPPPLDVQTTWSQTHNVTVPDNFHKEWVYYLNEQAQINISFTVKSNTSEPLILVIAQGSESLNQWIENPSRPNTPLSWNLIHGNGMIQQNITKPSDYYVAVGNPNQQEIEVQLDVRIQTLIYNTTGAYQKCSLGHGLCVLKLFFLGVDSAVLTTTGPQQDVNGVEWYVKLSYGPRWITYFVGSGVLTIVILLVFKIFTYLLVNGHSQQNVDITTGRSPLLPNKDDDTASLGSSYDSVSHDEEDIEGKLDVSSKLLNEGEADTLRRLCAVCCDAQRDSFFLPCGHCATCFTCGTRIADEAGTCPICRRKMKKLRKIFTV